MGRIALAVGAGSITQTFEDFYSCEFARVYKAAWLLARDDEDALDATQEAFGRAFARWRRLRREEWAAGWVITTAINVLKRRSRRLRDVETLVATTDEPTPDSFDLRYALRELPRRQREALVLFYIGDHPVHAVAHLMGVSDGTVKAHLAQGREALRELLEVRHA